MLYLYGALNVRQITHAIEGLNRQFRKVTKSKSVFPTDDSLLKMLYLAMVDITKKNGRAAEYINKTYINISKSHQNAKMARTTIFLRSRDTL